MGVLISVAAVYGWRNDIFDTLVLPDRVERDVLVGRILTDLGELSMVYTEPDYVKTLFSIWSRSHMKEWSDLVETMYYEYDPIENYDRKESETVNDTHTDNTVVNKNNSIQRDGTTDMGVDTTNHSNVTGDGGENYTDTRNAEDKRTLSHDNTINVGENRNLSKTGSDNTHTVQTESVAAFNNATPVQRSKTETDTDVTSSLRDTGTVDTDTTDHGSGTDNLKMSGTFSRESDSNWHEQTVGTVTEDTNVRNLENINGSEDTSAKNNGSGERVREMRSHGNIGVTTTQQMIMQQRDIVKFNIYDYIVGQFKENFCVMIW